LASKKNVIGQHIELASKKIMEGQHVELAGKKKIMRGQHVELASKKKKRKKEIIYEKRDSRCVTIDLRCFKQLQVSG